MMRSGLIATLLIALAACPLARAGGPIPQQVVNLHTGPGPFYGSSPADMVVVGGIAFFRADDGIHGAELWRSDGTPAGTWMVKDIHPGVQGSTPFRLTVLGTEVCFSADDGTHGSELWCSDGSEAGTRMVRSIRPGRIGSRPESLTPMGGVLYFVADDGERGRELWRSDGSAAGTTLVRDIEAGAGSSHPNSLRVVNGILMFSAFRADAGRELWRSNGTAGGTTLVRDIRAGTDSALSNTDNAAVRQGFFYFPAHDGINGRELWRSDGTFSGTTLVTVLNPAGDSNPSGLVNTDVGLLFWASMGTGSRLWRSDGTSAGTVELPGWSSQGASNGALSLGGVAYFVGGASHSLWRTDGTVVGTMEVGRTDPAASFDFVSQLTLYDSQVFFRASSPSHGTELHRYPPGGSIARVTDINPGTPSAIPTDLTVVGSRLLFAANRETFGRELWRYQTGVGASMVANIADDGGSSRPRIHGVIGNRIVFTAFRDDLGRELWASDGSAAGTELLADADPGPANGIRRLDSAHHVMAEHDGALYYFAYEPATGEELWRTDGTPAGTHRVTDLCDQFAGCSAFDFSTPHHAMLSAGGYLWFAATDDFGTARVWRSDGSAAGTQAAEPRVRVSDTLFVHPVAAAGNHLFVAGRGDADVNAGFELWKVDFASATSSLVRDLAPGSSSFPDWLTSVGSTLYFAATDPAAGRELFKSDGTFAGTTMVRDIADGPAHANPRHLTAHGGKLYFTADDGVIGRELWLSDGSTAGTQPLRDIFPGLAGSSPLGLFSAGPWLYFSAFHPDNGVGLWRSDGTEAGTVLLTDLGASDSGGMTATMLDIWSTSTPDFGYTDLELYLTNMTGGAAPYAAQTEFVQVADGRVVFRGCQRSVGCQLWITDGSAEGTFRLTDFGPAPGGASPGHLTAIGNTVYFAATDEVGQRELWKIALPLGEPVFANGFEDM